MSKDVSDKLSENPLLAQLTREAMGETITFWGYIGPSENKDIIALYPNLQSPADYVEISRTDILHVEDVPENILLFGAKVIWVRRDAKIGRRRLDTAEASLAVPAAVRQLPQDDDIVEVQKGRLRMRMRSPSVRSDCVSPCATCRDCSSVCICICRYTDPEL